MGLVSVVCLLSYFSSRTDSFEDQIRQNERIEATLRKYSEEIDNSDLAGKDDRIHAAKYWINTVLAKKVPNLLKRKWYVSLPGWIHKPLSFDAKLQELLIELHENEKGHY